MSKEAKLNTILFVVALVLFLIAWYLPGLHQMKYQYLSDIQADDIQSIRIETQNTPTIKLIKDNNSWFLQEPYQLPANILRVDTLTALLNKRSYEHFSVTTDELKRFQLDQPLLSIWFDDQQFDMGTTDPIKQQRYVTQNNGPDTENHEIHLINGIIYFQLHAAVSTFISPYLLPPKAKINSMHWLDTQITRSDNGWLLTPEMSEVSQGSIKQLLLFWQQAQASKVETDIEFSVENIQTAALDSAVLDIEKNSTKKNAIEHNTIVLNISYPFENTIKTEELRYIIVQEGNQLKLIRPDLKLAYLISSQTLKTITEFFPEGALE